jgi:adenylyltransferase and sulfurtransferase
MTEKEALAARITDLENELRLLRLQQQKYEEAKDERSEENDPPRSLPLELDEYIRYGRQMILPQIGLPGQLALKRSSVLVIGSGGLGCPVLLYLAAAGVGIQSSVQTFDAGKIGIADHDRVDLSNLHRQILHKASSVGHKKTQSAEIALKEFSSLL